MKEIWKEIFDGYYEVSDLGRVRRAKPGQHTHVGKILTHAKGRCNKYALVTLSVDGKPLYRYVHKLVAEAFIGPCPVGKEVNHKDTNRMNNRLDNLEYLTKPENTAHAVKHGLMAGERNGNASLTNQQVREIRSKWIPYKRTQKSLAAEYGIAEAVVQGIIVRRYWKTVS